MQRKTIAHAQQAQRLRVEVHTPYTLCCLICGDPLRGDSWSVVNGWSCCAQASCRYTSLPYVILALITRRRLVPDHEDKHGIRWYRVADAEDPRILDIRAIAWQAAERGLYPRA